jgi:hypothetical protein
MTNFPTSLDAFVNPVGTDKVNNVNALLKHDRQHSDANDAIEALEVKVGINGSADTNSIDYKLSGITAGAVSVSTTGTQTLTNKSLVDASTYFIDDLDNTKKMQFQVSGVTASTTRTLTVPDENTTIVGTDATQTLTNKTLTSPKVGTSINDTNGNEIIKTPATASAVNEVTVTNAATANDPLISATGDDTDIGLKLQGKGTGKVKLGLADIAFPNADGSNGQIIQTDGAGNLSFVDVTTPISSFTITAGQAFTGATSPEPVFISGNTTESFVAFASSAIGANFGDNSNDVKYAMPIVVSAGYGIAFNRVTLSIQKVASPVDDLTVKIWSDVAGTPTAVLQTSTTTLSGGTVTGSYASYNFDFTTFNLAAGTYYVTIERSGAADAVNYYQLAAAATTIGCQIGNAAGNSWSARSGEKPTLTLSLVQTGGRVYKSYAGGTVGTYGTSNFTNLVNTTPLKVFDGYVTTTTSAGGTATFAFSGRIATFSGLTAGSDYYVKNDGTIGTSAGDTSIPAGRASSTTQLFIQ